MNGEGCEQLAMIVGEAGKNTSINIVTTRTGRGCQEGTAENIWEYERMCQYNYIYIDMCVNIHIYVYAYISIVQATLTVAQADVCSMLCLLASTTVRDLSI